LEPEGRQDQDLAQSERQIAGNPLAEIEKEDGYQPEGGGTIGEAIDAKNPRISPEASDDVTS
jgi:hypothetical protein